MRTTAWIFAGILFLGLGAGMLYQVTVDAQAVVILNHATVAWDPVTKDVQGNPETIKEAEMAIWPAGANIQTATPIGWMSGLAPTTPIGGISIDGLLQGRASGTYQIAVRVYDLAGNASAWSVPLVGTWDVVAPAAPTGFRIVVTVQVIPTGQ